MKKLTLFFVSLLMTLSMVAQNSITFNTASYTIKSISRGYLYYDSNNGDYVTSSSHTTLVNATPTGAENELFAFLRTDRTAAGECYMYSVVAKKFVTYTGSNGVALELTSDPVCTWKLVSNGDYFVITVPNTTNTCINITNWSAKYGCKVIDTAPDDGNKMTIKSVGTVELSDAIKKIKVLQGEDIFETPEAGKYYILKGDNQSNPWLTGNTNDNGSIIVSSQKNDAAIFLKTKNGLKLLKTGKYLGMKGSVVSYVDNETTINLDQKDNTEGKYAVQVDNNWMYNNNTDGITHESSGWITNIERFWGFIEVQPTDITATLTDAKGNSYSGTYKGFAGISEPNLSWDGMTNGAWDGNNFTATITYPFAYPVSEPTLLCIYPSTDRTAPKLLYASDDNVKVLANETAPAGDEYKWIIAPAFDDANVAFVIKNVAENKYIYSAAENDQSILNTENTVILSDTPSRFDYVADNDFRFAGKDKLYLSINSDGDADVYLGVHRSAHNGTDIAVPTDFPVAKVTYSNNDTRYKYTLQKAVEDATTGSTLTLLAETDAEYLLPAGVTLNKNGFEAPNVKETIATIGDNRYASLADAVKAATSGQTITLHKNTEEAVEVPFDVTLNKNNFAADNVIKEQPFANYVVLPQGVTQSTYKEIFGTNTVSDGTNNYATLQAAVDAVAGKENAVLYCKPGADVGALQHAPVTSTLTVYGNGANVTGAAERDFDLGNTDLSGGKDITADMTLTVKYLNGCGAWGAKATEHTVNLVFENCANMGKVFITGTTGTLNITMTDCAFEGVIKEAVYSNADGAITLTDVAFSNLNKAINLNHKAAGTQTVTINGCSFTNCGNDVAADQIPVRVLSSVEGGKSVLNVSNTTFTGTPEGGADILLDYAVGLTEASIATTAANVVVENENNVGTPTTTEADKEYALTTAKPVAKIGEVEYMTLADAVAAAQNDATQITLIADVKLSETVTIPAGKTATLDLNGKAITGGWNGNSTTNHIYALDNKGKLTVMSSVEGGKIISRGIYNYGELILNSGTIDACDGNGGYAVNNKSGSTFSMNGGILIASYEDDHQSSSGGYDATALNVPSGCTATLNGGTITDVCDFTFAIAAAGTLNVPETSTVLVQGNHGAVSVSGGTTTINAGTFKVIKDDYARTDNVMYVTGGELIINGGTFVGDSDTASGGSCVCDTKGSATINGGSFSGSSGGDVWGTTGTTIKGGKFENLTEKQHIAEGYELLEDGTVAEVVCVAMIGEQKFATLADALAAAAEMTDDVTVVIKDKVTLSQSLVGNYSSIKFVGATTAAKSAEAKPEIYLDVQGYIEAAGKKVAFEGLTLSKSEGGFIGNAGFMNVAFGVYNVDEVTYTDCTFANGAYAGAGKVTYFGCTFYRSHDKYGLWAYGDVDVTVDGCTFADYRGIKMYAEGRAKTVDLTVKNTDFSAVDNKPAIVLTYGERVTLANNKYSSTGTFELDLNGSPNGTLVTSDVAPTCKNDNGACGVLVDGKIYTTVAQAAAVATSGSQVTLLHNSTETVEFAQGVELNKNNCTADNVTVAQPVAKIGEKGYSTLEEAFKAATEGQTITLVDDATPVLKSQSAITKAAVIDLGGKTLTLTEDDLYFGTTTFKNGTIVVDSSVKPSTAVFWMFANQTLTFDNVKIVATGVTGTYLIGLEGDNSDLNLLNGSEILVENTTALDLDIICVNGTNTCDIKVENSKVNVTNLDGRVFFRGNYTVKDSEVNLAGITKAGFRIEAGQTLSIEGTSKVIIEGEPRDGGIHLTDLTATYTKAETAEVTATVNEPKVAKVGENTYRTLADAVAAVEDGGTITLIANETFTKNNRYNNGGWWDGLGYSGDKSFTIDLNGFTVSQDGSLNDYLFWFKNVGSKANTITIKNGTLDAGTTAYCALCTASSHENQLTINTEDLNLINNISNGSTVKVRAGSVLNVNAGTKITGKNSYLGIENWKATVNIYDGAEIYMNGTASDNGCLVGVGGGGTINVYGGYGKGVKGGFIAMTSGGTINVEGGEWIANTDGTVGNNSNLYVLTAQSNKYESGFAGPSIINVTGGTFRGGMDAWVLNNLEGEKAELNITGGSFNVNPASYVADGYVAVDNNGVWTVEKAAAKIGEKGYATLADAVAAAKEGETVTILAGTHSEGTIKLPATLKNVTIKGAEGAILKDMTISAADGNAYSYVGLTFDGITFDNSRLLFTGWRNGDEIIENLTVTNCTFKNLNDNTNTAPVHINKDASEAVNGFTFTNNVIDGATGGSKSGIYLQATGNVVVENNVINNVSFRPYVIQLTTDDGIADNFTVTGNTFSGSAIGRAQGLGNNAEGTDAVNLVVSNNIFKDITNAQQICYWNFNAEKTTADLSGNYYDIDIVADPNKIYYNSAAQNTNDLIEKGIFPIYTELNEDGTINTASAYYPPVVMIGEKGYQSVKEALEAAKAENLTDVVITIVGKNTAATADEFDLVYKTAFDNVTFKQENGNNPYYFEGLYTGSRANNGKFVFDGVNIAVTANGQYMLEGDVVLSNNSSIQSSAEANCFVYNANVTIEAGSKIDGVIEDIRGGSLIIDGGKDDGSYCDEPALRDAILIVNWENSNLVLQNGAYVKVNSADEVGRLTVNGTMDVTNSKLDSYQWIDVKGTMKLNVGSIITTNEVKGAGKIIVDATDITSTTTVIRANMSGFTGTVEVVGNDLVSYSVTNEGLVLEYGLTGQGTEADPYLIKNVKNLKFFRNSVNAGETTYNAEGKYVALGADIDLTGIENWEPIGTFDYSFDSNFDGNGFAIKNLKMTDNTAANGYAYLGFFGVTANNVVKNFQIENVTINSEGQIVAAAIAYPYYTTVSDITVKGNIAIKGGNYTAGVLAYTRLCLNASNLAVVGNEGSYITGAQVVGGVIADIQMNKGLVANYSNFSAEGVTITGTKNVGGISGIIATQSLNGATVKNVTLVSDDARVGIVAGCLGGTSTISGVTYENVTGATALLGATYESKAIEAKAGNTYYATLDAALKAEGDDVVELLTTYEVAAGETKTLDLNGKTVTMVYTAKATKNHTMVSNSGNLTIESSVAGGKLSYTYAGENLGTTCAANTVTSEPGSVLTVKSGTIENLTFDSGVIAYAIDGLTNGSLGDVTVNIEGGVITSKRQAVRIFANSTTNTGALNISGGEFTGRVIVQNASAKANKAVLNITDGTFNANDYKSDVLYVGGSSSATIDIQASVSGGTFKGDITETHVEKFISGGTFTTDVTKFCAEHFICQANADGTYGVIADPSYIAELVIDDAEGKDFVNDSEKFVGTLTYKRSFAEGYWNTLFVPFEIPMSMLSDYDVAYINDMHSYDKNYDGVIEEFGLEVIYIKDETATLNASHPYVIRPKNAEAAYMELVLTDATLFSSLEQTDVTCSSAYMNFTFKGSYSEIAVSETDRYYILTVDENGEQTFGYAPAGSTLKPYRFYFTMESRGGSYVKVDDTAFKSVRIYVQGEGDTTGIVGTEFDTNGEELIYDLQGRRVLEPKKGGIYIINGKKVYYNK